MKEIIVGIDFSKSSIQAFHYALKLAEVCQCKIKLVYVCKSRDKESNLIKDERGLGTSIIDNFEKLIAENDGFKELISYKILDGKIWEEISNQAKYTDAELIITGAHGMSGFEELWVGNNAMKIVSYSEKPVLCVKKNFKLKKPIIEKIVLPIDHTKGTMHKIPFILQLASTFKAQINVLSIYNSKQKQIEENVDENTKLAMESIINSGLRYINEKKISDNPAKITIEYAIKRNADLISVMTENESAQSVFLGPIPQQIINQSPIPVISFRSNVTTKFSPKPQMVAAK
jgi:nucleotide-binding universal stress UspA family protein